MDDYISREEAIELLTTALDDDWESEYALDRLREIPVSVIPAADVVEVVRCKDCIHAGDRDCPIDWPKNGEDYCSFGERRDDNG